MRYDNSDGTLYDERIRLPMPIPKGWVKQTVPSTERVLPEFSQKIIHAVSAWMYNPKPQDTRGEDKESNNIVLSGWHDLLRGENNKQIFGIGPKGKSYYYYTIYGSIDPLTHKVSVDTIDASYYEYI